MTGADISLSVKALRLDRRVMTESISIVSILIGRIGLDPSTPNNPGAGESGAVVGGGGNWRLFWADLCEEAESVI